MKQKIPMGWFAGGAAVVVLELIAVAGWQGWIPTRSLEQQARQQSMQPHPQARPAAVAQAAPASAAAPRPEDRYYAELRDKLRWVEARMNGSTMLTPDLESRMMLAKSAARRAGLDEVGLGFEDVYGIINAETSWVPRTGASKDGTPNLGVAQFEPATAQALGLRDPHDVVEAVHVAAQHMKEAAVWSSGRIAGLKLNRKTRAAKLREGVSIYYNLSSRGRAAWDGRNTHKLPPETNRHIQNARLGAQQAAFLDAQLQAMNQPRGPAVVTASVSQPGG